MSEHDITTRDQLQAIYREPNERVKAKKGQVIEKATARFVAASPFFCLATAGTDGSCDVSPRGGPPGQLKVVNGGRSVAFPDLSGNNLIDSIANLVDNPHAGLLVIVPGSDETLRIDGSARLTTDPEVLDLWSDELRVIRLAVVVDVDSVFMHCAKAFRRGNVWQPDTWPSVDDTEMPQVFNDITGSDDDPNLMRQYLEAGYKESLDAERV